MRAKLVQPLAILEAVLVVFLIVPLVTQGVYRLMPGFESWQVDTVGFPFPVFVDVVMAGVSLLAMCLHRKTAAAYGMTLRHAGAHLDIAAACFIPVVLANLPFGMGINHTTWDGALILAGVQIALLFCLVLILRKKPSPQAFAIASMLLCMPLLRGADAIVGKAIVLFLTYALFVGFGEEMLYRGYIQSRLDEAFGKPYQFFGVSFGWGILIMALLFGLTHAGILGWIFGFSGEITLAWGFWTIFSGLVFGLVREKSGGILAPALLHGLPQAIAMTAMLFLN